MNKPTGPQLKALALIADNPGHVLATPTSLKLTGEWKRINGNTETSLTRRAEAVHGAPLIKRSAEPVLSGTRTIYGKPSNYGLHAWELTDTGRAVLAEFGPKTPEQGAEQQAPAADADQVAAGIAAACTTLATAGHAGAQPGSMAEQLERRGPSAQVAADVDAAREVLREKFTCIDDQPSRNSGFTAAWAPTFPGAVRIGRMQGMRSARPEGAYTPATKLWDDCMAEYARELSGAGFTVSRTDDRGLIVYRNRPAAPAPGEGVELGGGEPDAEQGPTSVGRAGKDREHPQYAERHADAVAGLALLGVHPGRLVDLRIRDNAVFRDERSGAVVKVGRPGTGVRALLELRVSWWLQTAGLPVATPLLSTPAMVGDRPVTLWEDATGGRPSGEMVSCAELGELHRVLHALPVPEHFEIPEYDPWDGIPSRIDAALFTGAQRAWVRAWAVELEAEFRETRAGAQRVVVHGDGGPHNTLRRLRDGQALMIDWETVAVGQAVVDGAHIAWESSPFTPPAWWDERGYVTAYGADPRELPGFSLAWRMRTLTSLLFAGRQAGTSAAARAQADHRIDSLINDRPRPWRWSSI